MAAALAILTEALDEPGTDIAHSLHRLTLDAAAAVTSYLGLSVVVSHSDSPFTVTALAEGALASDIRTSLHLSLLGPNDPQNSPAVAIILYAGSPGAFVDLAADLSSSSISTSPSPPGRCPRDSCARHQRSTKPSAFSSGAATPHSKPTGNSTPRLPTPEPTDTPPPTTSSPRSTPATMTSISASTGGCPINGGSDLDVVVQERHELAPGVLPQPHDRRVLSTHLAANSTKRSLAASVGAG